MSRERTSPRGVTGFLDGARTFVEGLRFLAARPRLVPFVGIPFVLTVLVFVAVAIVAFMTFADLQQAFFAERSEWYWSWPGAEVVAWIIFVVLFGAFSFLTFVSIGSMITAPFSDYLSLQVERELLPGSNPAAGAEAFAVDVLRSLKHEGIRLTLYLVLLAACAPLLLVPLLGQLAFSVALTFISIRYLAWDGLDYCMARRRMGFRAKMAFLRHSRARTVGYGTVSFLLLALPLTTLFVLPLNAIGGSILYCKIRREQIG